MLQANYTAHNLAGTDTYPENLDDDQQKIQLLESKISTLESRMSQVIDPEFNKLSDILQISSYPEIKFRTYKDRKRILITGGAGFVGSHLVDALMLDGHEVRHLSFISDVFHFSGDSKFSTKFL